MKAVFHGNYVTVFLDDPAKYEALKMFSNKYFAYELKKWNPDIKAYEYFMIRRYWFNPSKLSFTTFRGLTVRVKRIAENLKMGCVEAKYRELNYDLGEAKFLRKYQLEALISILKQVELQGAATLMSATGSGKTEIAVALHKVLNPGKTFFLSLNTDLLIQAKQRFMKYGVEAGLVNKDYFQIDRNVVCCTVQTLYRVIRTYETFTYERGEEVNEEVRYLLEETDVEDKLKLYETYRKADLVIMDECQHVPARTVWYTSMANPTALRLALSATPWRDDGRDLDIYACYGDMVPRRILSSELIELGYLVPVKIYFAHYFPKYAKDFEGKRGGPWLFNKVKKAVFQDPVRNQLIARIAQKSPKPFMILVKEIKHGELIERECRKLGLKVAFLYGHVDPDIRALMFDLVRREKIDGIIATTLADEGLDLPALRTLILAGGGKSSTRALQRVGRITRPWANKKYGIVIDIWDHIRYFEDHASRRRKIYSTEPKWQIKDILLR